MARGRGTWHVACCPLSCCPGRSAATAAAEAGALWSSGCAGLLVSPRSHPLQRFPPLMPAVPSASMAVLVLTRVRGAPFALPWRTKRLLCGDLITGHLEPCVCRDSACASASQNHESSSPLCSGDARTRPGRADTRAAQTPGTDRGSPRGSPENCRVAGEGTHNRVHGPSTEASLRVHCGPESAALVPDVTAFSVTRSCPQTQFTGVGRPWRVGVFLAVGGSGERFFQCFCDHESRGTSLPLPLEPFT